MNRENKDYSYLEEKIPDQGYYSPSTMETERKVEYKALLTI